MNSQPILQTTDRSGKSSEKLRKPRVCILADCRDWAHDISASQIKQLLVDAFDITIRYGVDYPKLSLADYDLVHICFWEERRYQLIGLPQERIVKMVSSHRWQDNSAYGPCTPEQFARHYLMNCGTVICGSRRLTATIENVFPRTFHTPKGVDVTRFNPGARRPGPGLMFGWAGNAEDEVKGFSDIVKPACCDAGRFPLLSATGSWPHAEMEKFYRQIDVFIVASRHEGDPLTLIEAMACGCFPVAVDVGIVPELIEHGRNGYIVPDRSVRAFREAFEWCENHRDEVHAAGRANAELISRERDWRVCAQAFARVYRDTLAYAAAAPAPPPSKMSDGLSIFLQETALNCRRTFARLKRILRRSRDP